MYIMAMKKTDQMQKTLNNLESFVREYIYPMKEKEDMLYNHF